MKYSSFLLLSLLIHHAIAPAFSMEQTKQNSNTENYLSTTTSTARKAIEAFLSPQDLNARDACSRTSHLPTRVLDTFKAIDAATTPKDSYKAVEAFMHDFPFHLQDTFQERGIIKATLERVKDAFFVNLSPYLMAPYHKSSFSMEELEMIASILQQNPFYNVVLRF